MIPYFLKEKIKQDSSDCGCEEILQIELYGLVGISKSDFLVRALIYKLQHLMRGHVIIFVRYLPCIFF